VIRDFNLQLQSEISPKPDLPDAVWW